MAKQTKEEIAARKRAYNAANREKITAQTKAYKVAHREEIVAKTQSYREARRAELAEKSRRYTATHRDHVLARNAAYSKEHRAEIAAQHKTVREQARVHKQNRRAQQLNASGTFTLATWRALCEYFGNVCLGCGQVRVLEIDHVVPMLQGGTNYISNIQPLCRSCNSHKAKKHTDYRDPARLAAFLESLED